ncbi:hypothetical protein KM1_319460 [Entamoeba histolytica HM-3:IMSS]|uniref:Glutamine amidotransferase domain-containing protein n=3 Tax=Entamoeba histolytica TaxID=5759 RepID=C4MB65_ENTH1|nr:hypothetical protein EHI_040810 [Entamoeba histolytica HM-1:IMSS]EAL42961.1 hypothetical protein EHI_040810 [Entamoeba histolytica HM-1:IMSS]EMS16097.1 hypothetical protein KM1_319460 [Entamoeba histolytica HM-3:IMSS]GAT99164.1 hypothetical protein CL6EHI_040810 [Entamoeba histolytica]|eukprot:XP_648345.1 hypothetical protein EHI_040810 [Entamoeba histolytica HM-1:IMSS]
MNSIKVLVLKKHPGGIHLWNKLSKLSQKYGGYKINVSILREDGFGYEDIRKVSPDVLFFSDSAGSPTVINDRELEAIQLYVTQNTGKSIIASYATFFYEETYHQTVLRYDNRKLLPLFGIKQDTQFFSIKNRSIKLKSCNKNGELLLNGINRNIQGYLSTQTVVGGWEQCLLDGTIIAQDFKSSSVIIQRTTPCYCAMYINSMPEYSDMNICCDSELVYRMITYCYKLSHSTLQTLCCQSINSTNKLKSLLKSANFEKAPSIPKHLFLSTCLHRFKFSQQKLKYFNDIGISSELTNLALFKTKKYSQTCSWKEP